MNHNCYDLIHDLNEDGTFHEMGKMTAREEFSAQIWVYLDKGSQFNYELLTSDFVTGYKVLQF